jgi:GntR family transcriptional regulator
VVAPDYSADLLVPYAASVAEVDHDSPEPLYQQVARFLRDRIRSGELTARVPSVKTISQEYGISHITAEKAMNVLRAEGLVVSTPGKGSYVAR